MRMSSYTKNAENDNNAYWGEDNIKSFKMVILSSDLLSLVYLFDLAKRRLLVIRALS